MVEATAMVLSKMVGARVRRKEDPRLITGSSTYVDDIHLPGMTYLAFARSPYAHGVLKGVDTSAAEAVPGVVATLTYEDLARIMVDVEGETKGETTGEDSVQEELEEIPVPPILPLAQSKVRNRKSTRLNSSHVKISY